MAVGGVGVGPNEHQRLAHHLEMSTTMGGGNGAASAASANEEGMKSYRAK
jgi:hypothetical protein